MYRIILLALVFAQTPADPPKTFTQKVLKQLPVWEADKLAQYERPELDTIYRDLDDSVSEEQLQADWDELEAVDDALKTRDVI